MQDRAEHRLALEPDRFAPGTARAWLRRVLPPGTLAGDACLLVSELITNSLRHARFAPGDQIAVEVAVARDALLVAVWDPGPGFVPRPAPRPFRESAGGGGLYLLEQLARRWGVEGEGPTRVWAELPGGAEEGSFGGTG